MAGHCIVCGMGDVGYRIVELLHRLGETVVEITDRVLDERRQRAEALGVRILLGDARSDRLLREAGLDSAKTLIAATRSKLPRTSESTRSPSRKRPVFSLTRFPQRAGILITLVRKDDL